MENKIYFNQNLKLMRKAYKLTLRELSQRTGVSDAYLSQIENSKRDGVTVRTAVMVCDYFQIEFRDFVFREIKEVTTEIKHSVIWNDNA